MSVTQILQIIIIVTDALNDAVIEGADRGKIGGVIDILGMLEDVLATQAGKGVL